jgi:alpha-1,3-glucosyltransferase
VHPPWSNPWVSYSPSLFAESLVELINSTRLFLRLALTTVLTTLALFLPFLPPFAPLHTIVGPIVRLFPFHRGLFEDKVATFWCLTDVLAKWRVRLTRATLVRTSTVLTLAAFSPAVVGLIATGWRIPRAEAPSKGEDKHKHTEKGDEMTEKWTPTLPLLPYAMLTSSLAFFLFSFHVHEKTLLLPLLPMTALLSGSAPESTVYEWGMLVNNVGVFR